MWHLDLHTTVQAIQRAYRPMLKPLGLTYPQYVVMPALRKADGVSVVDLGRATRLDSPTLTPLLKRLQDKGVLTRERDTADECGLVVALTEAGRELQRAAWDVPERVVCEVGLSDEDLVLPHRLCVGMRLSLQENETPRT